jgi:hypothetical protein
MFCRDVCAGHNEGRELADLFGASGEHRRNIRLELCTGQTHMYMYARLGTLPCP